jgi:hypothetical protein
VHLDNIKSFIYPTDAQLDCSKNDKIYMTGAPTCFGFSHPSSESYYMCFVKVVSIRNQLKCIVYRICSEYAATRPNRFCKRRISTDY